MKVAVITLHRVFNYGSVLQAYATQKTFNDLGCDVEIIDYITAQRTNKRLFLGTADSGKNKSVRRYVYLLLRAVSIIMKKFSFGSFIKKHINLTTVKYITPEDLENNPPEADVYVTGSDQVWNSQYNQGIDGGFFLKFAPDDKKKIAYVASFGKNELDESEKNETAKLLKRYSALSVREDVAVDIIKDLGLKSSCLIDPTLQIEKENWISIASKRLVKEKYLILMLLYNEDNGATEYARKIADQKGLKLVKISWEMKKPKMVDKLFTHRSPEDFLSLFLNAEFVVTNSFHGLAFSINLNKQFVVVPRTEFNSRIESLLRITGLFDRMVDNMEEALLCAESEIEYDSVNDILEEEREKAIAFLKESLK